MGLTKMVKLKIWPKVLSGGLVKKDGLGHAYFFLMKLES